MLAFPRFSSGQINQLFVFSEVYKFRLLDFTCFSLRAVFALHSASRLLSTIFRLTLQVYHVPNDNYAQACPF